MGWGEYTNIIANYTMPVRIHDYKNIMLRNAVEWESIFPNATRSSQYPNMTIVNLGETNSVGINVYAPMKNAEKGLLEKSVELISWLFTSSAPSTLGGAYPLPIPNANFVVHSAGYGFWGYCYNNMFVALDHVETSRFSSLDDLINVAKMFNSIFDGDVASLSKRSDLTLQKSDGMTLSFVGRKQVPEGESVTLRWGVPEDLKDCWIRFDTSEGRASIEDEKAQTVTVSHLPPGAPFNATLYAISPDGKEWRYATLAVAPPPKE